MKRCIIVGGGVAGLTAGILLQASGWQCELLEKGQEAGGCCTGWTRDGCEIDACLHWMNGTKPGSELNKFWVRTGALDGVEIIQNEYLYASEQNGERITLWREPERLRETMRRISPQDRAQTDRLIDGIYAAEKALRGKRYVSEWSYLYRYGRKSLSALSEQFSHPHLRRFLIDYLGGELPVAAWLMVAGGFCSGDCGLPRGGSRGVTQRMASRFISLGGTLRCKTEAQQILVRNEAAVAVRTDADELACDAVICACDPNVTFGRLLGGRYLPPQLARRYRDPQRFPIFSSIHAAFELDADCPVPQGTTVLCQPSAEDSQPAQRVAVRNFSYDPSFAPQGKTVVQCMAFQREKECADWFRLAQKAEEYRAQKEAVSASFSQLISDRWGCQPKLLDCWTPVSYSHYLNAYRGDYLSFGWTNLTDAVRNVSPHIHGLRNVFLATQWQTVPGGLPRAARAGEAAAGCARNPS